MGMSVFFFLELVPVAIIFAITLFGIRALRGASGKDAKELDFKVQSILSPVLYFAVCLPIAMGIEEFNIGPFLILRLALALLFFVFSIVLALRANHELQVAGRGHAEPVVKQTGRMVSSGPYAFTRHPMALAISALMAGELAVFPSVSVLASVLIVTLSYVFFLRAFQENALTIRFGKVYRAYAERVPFILPKKPGKLIFTLVDWNT